MSGEDRRAEVSADLAAQIADAAGPKNSCPVAEANADMLLDFEGPNGDGTPGVASKSDGRNYDF